MHRRLTSALVAAVLVVSACGQSTTTPSLSLNASVNPSAPFASATAQPIAITGSAYEAIPAATTGGKVVLAEWQFPDTVNPYFALHETDIEVSDSMFDGLLTVTPDLKYVPDLATNIPTLDNGGVVLKGSGMDVSWRLRPGMQWSDGKPINCDDIRATWLWILDKDNTHLAAGTIGWQDVTGVDGGTGTDCVMHFGKTYEGYLTLVSPLLPAHYITTVPVKDAQARLYPMSNLAGGVYSGSYIPASVEGHAKITLKPNPSWQTIGGHVPWLASVTWRYYGDAGTMIDGFKAGDVDVAQNLSNANLPALSAIDQARVISGDSLTYEMLAFNNVRFKARFGIDAANVIQAIKLATDRQEIANEALVGGNVRISNNFVSPLAWYYEDIGGSTKADPTTAYTLLANAGWTRGPDGYLTRGGKTLEFDWCTTTRQYRLDMLNLIAGQLKQIGIKINVVTRTDSDVFGLWDKVRADTACNLRHGNYDVAEFAYISSPDPLSGYRMRHSSQTPDNAPHDGENITRVSLPALDAAYETINTSVDLTEIRSAMLAIQDIYGSDRNTYEFPLYFRKDVWLVNPKLHNFAGNPTFSAGEWNIGDWWVG